MNIQMDRRRLLGLLAGLGASIAVSQGSALGAAVDCASKFDGLDPEAIRELGREYLALRPDAAALEDVTKLLASSANEAETLAQLRTRVSADFTAGRIVNLAGWFVSDTEGCIFVVLSRCGA